MPSFMYLFISYLYVLFSRPHSHVQGKSRENKVQSGRVVSYFFLHFLPVSGSDVYWSQATTDHFACQCLLWAAKLKVCEPRFHYMFFYQSFLHLPYKNRLNKNAKLSGNFSSLTIIQFIQRLILYEYVI